MADRVGETGSQSEAATWKGWGSHGSEARYKQTEVGVIPEDWELVPLSRCAKRITDGEHLTPQRSANGYYLLSARNILNGRIDVSDVHYVGEAEYKRIRQRCDPECGDVLISCSGTVGRVAIVPTGFQCVMVRSAALVKPDATMLSGLFAQYFLQSTAGQRQIFASLNQGAQANLFQNHIQALRIPLPPTKAEQEAIGQALSDADAFIASLEEMLAKKRDLKQGAMQELLTGKRRLPGFSGVWAKKRLGDSASLKARIGWQGLTTAEYLESGEYCLVTGTDFKDGVIDWENCHYVEKARFEQDKYIQLRENDVLVTKDGTIGKVALVRSLRMPATLNSGVFVIRPLNEAFDPAFFYYLLCSTVFTEFLAQLSAGSTINHLYQKDFVGFYYRSPGTLAEQNAIAAILSDIDADIAALKGKLDKARSLKQGLMQELLTGRIRLV